MCKKCVASTEQYKKKSSKKKPSLVRVKKYKWK